MVAIVAWGTQSLLVTSKKGIRTVTKTGGVAGTAGYLPICKRNFSIDLPADGNVFGMRHWASGGMALVAIGDFIRARGCNDASVEVGAWLGSILRGGQENGEDENRETCQGQDRLAA